MRPNRQPAALYNKLQLLLIVLVVLGHWRASEWIFLVNFYEHIRTFPLSFNGEPFSRVMVYGVAYIYDYCFSSGA